VTASFPLSDIQDIISFVDDVGSVLDDDSEHDGEGKRWGTLLISWTN